MTARKLRYFARNATADARLIVEVLEARADPPDASNISRDAYLRAGAFATIRERAFAARAILNHFRRIDSESSAASANLNLVVEATRSAFAAASSSAITHRAVSN